MVLEIKYYRNFYYCPHTLKSFCIDQVVEKPESRSDSGKTRLWKNQKVDQILFSLRKFSLSML